MVLRDSDSQRSPPTEARLRLPRCAAPSDRCTGSMKLPLNGVARIDVDTIVRCGCRSRCRLKGVVNRLTSIKYSEHGAFGFALYCGFYCRLNSNMTK